MNKKKINGIWFYGLSGSGKEDRYWANSIISKNYKILYDHSISVNHHYTLNGATWKGIG